jgi:hypothetical protein
MSVIYSLSVKYQTNISGLIIILFWILFFAFGIFITERYNHDGLIVVKFIKKNYNLIS